jgi:hypothetical protein
MMTVTGAELWVADELGLANVDRRATNMSPYCVNAALLNKVTVAEVTVNASTMNNLLESGRDTFVAIFPGGCHEGVACVHREADADSDAEDDLDRCDGAQRQTPEVHQSGDANDDAYH